MPPKIAKPTKAATKNLAKSLATHAELAPPSPKTPFPYDTLNGKQLFLIKSEPDSRLQNGKDISFSLEDLAKVDSEPWDGIRNHEAKNNLLRMHKGDLCLFYHSNCKVPGIVGVAEVVTEKPEADQQQFVKSSPYFDPKSDELNPRWWCPRVKFVGRLRRKIGLQEIKENPVSSSMDLVKRGRLSVNCVRPVEFEEVMKLHKACSETQNDIDCDADTGLKLA